MKNITKILSVILCLAMVLSFATVAFAEENSATISFADAANRTVMEDNQQVWQQNGITVTNDIGESTQPVKDYTNPVRFYAKTVVTIAYPGMTAIVVDCNNESYAGKLVESVTGAEAVASGKAVTITLPAAADSFVITLSAQVRVDNITVYTGAAPEAPIQVTEMNIDEHMDAAKWTFNGDKAAIENGQLNLPAVGDTAAAMLNESAQNASFNFTMTINEVPADCYDKWWDTELLIIARSSFADKSWSDDFAQTGYTLTSWGDMTEWFIGRAGNDDLSGKIVLNIADGQPHNFQLKVVNNADNTTVTVTLIVDGEQVAEIIDDGSKIKNERPALYPDAGNFTVRAKNVDVSIGTFKVADPEADTTLTIAEAIALGASKEHNAYTAGKYYVTGVVTEVYNEKYGNMYITDEAGNTFTVYGTYSADGSTRYDAMDVKPVAGDTVTVYGIIGQYNGTAQMKNGWLTAHTPAVEDPTPTEPTEPETSVPETTVPETTVPTTTKPVEPGTNPGTGDNGVLMTAVGMMMAAACLIVLVQKKRAV